MAKRKYIVSMTYPADLFFGSNVEAEIVKAAGHSGGSGMGFGERDHSWYDLSESQAVAKTKKLDALKIEGGNVEYREEEDD